MKNNQFLFFPAFLGFLSLGLLLNQSKETWVLGFVSFGLLFLFLYTIKLMGQRPGEEIVGLAEENENQEDVYTIGDPETEERPAGDQLSSGFLAEDFPVPPFRRERFRREILLPMVRSFLRNLSFRSKTENVVFAIWESGNFREFLAERGKLIIDCETRTTLDENEADLSALQMARSVRTRKGKRLLLPVFTPTRLYGALVLESLSGFTERDMEILLSECMNFALEWEARIDYELATLDPMTSVYNSSHFRLVLSEKFANKETLGLFLLEILATDNLQDFITYIGESLAFPVYRVNESILAFFLDESQIADIAITMQNLIKDLDSRDFYAEFLLAYSIRDTSMESSSDWEEDAFRKLAQARKKKNPAGRIA